MPGPDTEDHTRPVSLKPESGESYPQWPRKEARRRTPFWRKAVGGLTVAALTAGAIGFGAYEIVGKEKKAGREADIATARQKQVSAVQKEQKQGTHLRTISGKVLLFSGSSLRTSPTIYNSELFGFLPGNLKEKVPDGETVVMTAPIVSNEGTLWAEATPTQTPRQTAEALVDSTVYANLTNLLHQKLAMICNQGPDSHAEISPDFGYATSEGASTATYMTMHDVSQQTILEEQKNGLFPGCSYSLK